MPFARADWTRYRRNLPRPIEGKHLHGPAGLPRAFGQQILQLTDQRRAL
jgi:hypothetical protein